MPSNKPIGSLPAAAALQDADLLAIEQSGEAKKLAGEHLKSYVIAAAETAVAGAITPYIEEAEGYAEAAESAKDIVVSSVDVAQQAETLAVQAKEDAQSAAEDASSSKASAQTFAANAAASASSASSASSTAHSEAERAKGYADQAAATHDGVASFNARAGNVMPQEGDYTPEMLGLEPMSEVISEGPGGGPGKNLFRTVFDPQETTAVGNKVTKKGVTAEIQYDGSIKLSGTSTGPVNFYFGYSSVHQEACDAITYSASILGDPQYISVSIQSGATGSQATGGRVPYTFINVGEYDGYYYFIVSINGSNRKINATVRLQKEYNAEATSWEPYPASVKIENAAEGLLFKEVKAELPIMQETNGYAYPWPGGGYKNYVPDGLITGASGTIADMVKTVSRSGITIKSVNGKFIVNGSVSSGAISIYGPSFTLPAGTYYWSRWAPASLSATNNKLYLHYGSATKELNGSFTLSSDTSCRIEFFISAGITYNNDECYCQIESGSTGTAFTPYENICPIIPHSAVDLEVHNKNIFPKFTTVTKNENTLTVNEDGSYVITGTQPSSSYNTIEVACNIPPGTYTVSFKNAQALTDSSGIRCIFRTAGNVNNKTIYLNEANKKDTFTLNDTYIWCRFEIRSSGTITFGVPFWPQLEAGTVETDFIKPKKDAYVTDICINQWDEEWEPGSLDNNGSTIASSTQIRSKNFIPAFPSAEYRIVWPSPNGVVFEYDANKNYITRTGVTGGNTLTTNASTRYLKFRTGDGVTTYGRNISINYPSSVTDYYPYTGRQVYGGELDVITGILNSKYGIIDMGDIAWGWSSTRMVGYITGMKIKGTAYCTAYQQVASYPTMLATNCSFWVSDTYARIELNDQAYNDGDTFKAAVAGQKMVYELASPLTIQLTPQQIKQLLGTNYLDAGEYKLSVTFRTRGLISSDDIPEIIESEKILTTAPTVLNAEEAAIVRAKIGSKSNPNLLDNPWFTVNQRGLTTYSSRGYTVDRWIELATGANVTVNDNGVTLAPDTSMGFHQWFDDSFIKGKTVTLSILYQDGRMSAKTFVWPTSGSASYGDGIAINIYYGTVYQTHQGIAFIHGTTVSIKAVKLELGSVSTLANDAPPNYAEELAKCQRYFVRLKSTLATAANLVGDFALSATAIDFIIALPQSLAKIPTITQAGVQAVTVTGTVVPITSISAMDIIANNVRLRAYGTFTQNTYYKLTISQNSYIDLSADL